MTHDEEAQYLVGREAIAFALGIGVARLRRVMSYHIPPGLEVVGQVPVFGAWMPIWGMHVKEADRLRRLRESAVAYNLADFAPAWALSRSNGLYFVPAETVQAGLATVQDWCVDLEKYRDLVFFDEPLLMHDETYRLWNKAYSLGLEWPGGNDATDTGDDLAVVAGGADEAVRGRWDGDDLD